MTEAVQPADSGPMSVDDAVASLMPQAEEHEDAAPVEAAAEPEITEAEPNPAEDVSEAEAPGDDEDAADLQAAEAKPADPPQWWDAEAKAEFSKLTPEAQAIVFAQEEKREAVVAKAKQEASEERKAANQEVQGVRQLAEQLSTFLPQAVETFRNTWGDDPDWAAVAKERGAEEAFVLKAQYDDQKRQLQQVAEAKLQADAEARKVTLREENAKLTGTPLEPLPARQEVAKYLSETGYAPEELSAASARDLLMAHKAMLWDRAQAALKAKPKPPAVVAKPAPVRPGASIPQSSPQRAASAIANRYAQTRSVDDAVALLLAKGQRQ